MNTTHTKVIVVTVLSMVFGVTKPTFSIPVVVIVKGEVTSVDAGLGSAFSVGDTMTATLTYESSTPGGSFFLNAITASSFTVGSFSGALAPGPSPSDNEIDLTNQTPPSIDVIRFIHAFSPSLPFIDAFRFDFSLVDASGTAFNNASLPSSIALADFSSGTWSLLFGAPAVPKSSVRGDIVFMGAVIVVQNDCTLVDAINAANTNSAVMGCPAGTGPDEIHLSSDVTLVAVNNSSNGANGLPSIVSEIAIRGNGFTIRRDPTAADFRIVHVAAAGDLTLEKTTISGGSSTPFGGGILNEGMLTLTNSTVSGNVATDDYYAYGGGIQNEGTAILTTSTVSGNTTMASGAVYFYEKAGAGGLFNRGTLTLNESMISDNVADSEVTKGGGIVNAGTAFVNKSTVSGNMTRNSTFTDGGGIYNSDVMTLNNSTVSGNTASASFGSYGTYAYGGGIDNAGGNLTLNNSTVSGNSATASGATYPYSSYGSAGGIINTGTAVLNNSTVSGNTVWKAGVPGSVGGVHGLFNGTVTLNDSLIVSNSVDNCFGSILHNANNLADDATCGTIPASLTFFDPVLKNNGGPTMTHALLAGSNAIDGAGSCSFSEDQRGAGRIGDCDIGAFELIGCEDLVLAQNTIVGPQTWDTCHTAVLGPDLVVESSGHLSVTAGAQVIVRNDASFSSLEVGLDPNLQIASPESLELQGRSPTSAARPRR